MVFILQFIVLNCLGGAMSKQVNLKEQNRIFFIALKDQGSDELLDLNSYDKFLKVLIDLDREFGHRNMLLYLNSYKHPDAWYKWINKEQLMSQGKIKEALQIILRYRLRLPQHIPPKAFSSGTRYCKRKKLKKPAKANQVKEAKSEPQVDLEQPDKEISEIDLGLLDLVFDNLDNACEMAASISLGGRIEITDWHKLQIMRSLAKLAKAFQLDVEKVEELRYPDTDAGFSKMLASLLGEKEK